VKNAAGGPLRLGSVLDLGCGTGLGGAAFRPFCDWLVGVDLSPALIERARAKGLYDRLVAADLSDHLASDRNAEYHLVLAADVLVYLAELGHLAVEVARVLAPGGLFAFTVETHEGAGVRLQETLRYAHGTDHVRAAIASAGLTVLALEPASTRTEKGEPVQGLVAVARRGPRSHEALFQRHGGANERLQRLFIDRPTSRLCLFCVERFGIPASWSKHLNKPLPKCSACPPGIRNRSGGHCSLMSRSCAHCARKSTRACARSIRDRVESPASTISSGTRTGRWPKPGARLSGRPRRSATASGFGDDAVRVAGRHTAEKVLREIAEVIALIEDHPFAGRARNEVREGLRSFAAKPHVVFYRVVDDTPEVVRVLDGRQDIEEKFAARDGG
jgi:plasmid stabilization system protein ParE/SAM-dependent methyltransferase